MLLIRIPQDVEVQVGSIILYLKLRYGILFSYLVTLSSVSLETEFLSLLILKMG